MTVLVRAKAVSLSSLVILVFGYVLGPNEKYNLLFMRFFILVVIGQTGQLFHTKGL